MTSPLYIPDQAGLDAELRMFRDSPENKNCSFLFVEGESDEKFWNSRIIEKGCCIVFVVSFTENNRKQTGKTVVNKNIRTLNKSNLDGFVAILDADYDSLLNLPRENNICVTETHDLETLLLKSPFVFRKLLSEFGDSQLITAFESKNQTTIHNHLIDLTLPFARIEWLKQSLNPSVNLGDLHKHNTILPPEQWCLNQDQINEIAQNKGVDATSQTSQELLQRLHDIDPWLLCNGHTMIDILSIGLQKGAIGKNKTATSDNIASYIRGAIDNHHLYQTELCQSIINWQNNHSPYKVLALEGVQN